MYQYHYMMGNRSQTLQYECPQGMTWRDLERVFPTESELHRFQKYMVGQTMSVCDGVRFHHNRVHNEDCMKPCTFPGIKDEAHTEDSEYNWRCGYDGGHYENTECKDNPHGIVAYPHDVERYLRGLPVID